jgi:pimeloyl-ACP methyl ester carboxylesterase
MKKLCTSTFPLVLSLMAVACSPLPTQHAFVSTPSASGRVFAIPEVSPNPNIADPTFEALPGAKAYFGEIAGSGYRIEVPDKWNGDLVMFAHGWNTTRKLNVVNLPVRDLVIRQGAAWAASSYHAGGYNPDEGVQDTLILRELFKQKVGVPKRAFIYGRSMGGNVVVASLERYPDIYSGGLSECGGVNGIERLNYLLSYAALAGYFSGADFFAPEVKGPADVISLLNQKVYPALGTSADKLTDAGKRFRSAVINLGGGHRPFAEEGFAAAYRSNFDLAAIVITDTSFRGTALGNTDEKYHVDSELGVDDATLNAGVRRVAADPSARNFDTHYEFTRFKGNLKVPLLTIHGTGDSQVPIRAEQQYLEEVEASGTRRMLVQRAVRRLVHCDFSTAERNRAFTDLLGWVTTGAKPEGDDLRGSLLDVGKRWTEPLRQDDPGHP